MATITVTPGHTYGPTDTVNSTNLNDLGDPAASLDAGTIVNADISASADIGISKLEDVADMKVIGNTSGSAAAPQEVSVLDEDNMSSDSNTALATQQSIKAYVLSIVNQYFHLQETESSGVDSSTTLISNAYTKRPVASVSNNITGASVSSGVITLPAGTYEVKAFGLCNGDGFGAAPNRTRFRNVSDASNAILGASVHSIGQDNVDNPCQPLAYIQGTFTIAASKNFELQHYKDGSTSVAGGIACGSGDDEVYADVLIKKLD